jgi:hypothetical protein
VLEVQWVHRVGWVHAGRLTFPPEDSIGHSLGWFAAAAPIEQQRIPGAPIRTRVLLPILYIPKNAPGLPPAGYAPQEIIPAQLGRPTSAVKH